MKLEIQKDQSYTFEWSFYDKNIKDVPVSGTITVYKPGGTELVASTAVAIETDGTIKYTLAASNTSQDDKNYKIELVYQVGDVVHRPFYLFDIVYTPLQNTVRDDDLFLHLPELRNNSESVVETTSAGSTTTFIARDLKATNLDYKGGWVDIYIDDTTVHSAEITAYDKDLAQCTFQPAYTASIGSGLRVQVRASYQRFIDDAYDRFVHRDIRNRVPIKAGYIDTTVTDNLTIFKALYLICFSKIEEETDKWAIRASQFEKDYKAEYVKLNEAYDYNEDGEIDTAETYDKPSFINKSIER